MRKIISKQAVDFTVSKINNDEEVDTYILTCDGRYITVIGAIRGSTATTT